MLLNVFYLMWHHSVLLFSSNFKQEYKSALRYTNRLLQIEPQNRQGIELQEKITAQMKKGLRNLIVYICFDNRNVLLYGRHSVAPGGTFLSNKY